MTYLEFVKATICDLNQSAFEELKKILLGEYISFSIIDHENVTVDILAEKVCDYFNTLEARGAISVSDRTNIIAKIRHLAKLCAGEYIKQHEEQEAAK